MRKSPRAIRRARGPVVMTGAAAAVVALLAWRVAPTPAAGLAFALPFALLLACGGYAAALVLQDNPSARLWADASIVITVAAGPAALIRPAIITDDPVAGLLFPAAAWLAVQLWRSMTGSGSRMARAGADVTTALALGAILDLLLVRDANLAGAGILTVARACHLLDVVAAGNSPHWWYLVIPLLLLAAMHAARARWNGRLARLDARIRRRAGNRLGPGAAGIPHARAGAGGAGIQLLPPRDDVRARWPPARGLSGHNDAGVA